MLNVNNKKGKKMVILTSFKKSKEYEGEKYSVARFQPKGYAFPVLDFLAATGKDGEKLLLSQFDNPIKGYEHALLLGYRHRWTLIQKWLDGLSEEKNVVLCCWCPYSNSTKQQIIEFGSFCCHTGIIGQIINRCRPDITIMLDEDRKKRLLFRWMPDYLVDTIE